MDDVAHPWRWLSFAGGPLAGLAGGIGLVGGLVGPALAVPADPTPRVERLVVTLEASAVRSDRALIDPLASEGLAAVRAFAASVTPLVPNPADPALAAETGLDRFYVITLEPGVSAADVCALVPAPLRGSVVRPELGGPLVEVSGDITMDSAPQLENTVADPIDVPGVQPVNDPLFPEQWALRNVGQDIAGVVGTQDADVDAPPAWSLASGLIEPVVVAVLDTGVSETHPDLRQRLVPGINTADGSPDDTGDLVFSHGTGCAGVIAAEQGNNIGIAGVAGNARIMPVRIFNSFGFGYEVEFVAGLVHAADNGATIASMSIGFPFYSDAMAAAIEYAHGRDMVLVASTGNVNGQAVQFPALMDETIAVGATNNQDGLWANSTRGDEITLVAPGVNVLTTWDKTHERNTYKRQTGTSFAVPQVAGVAALVRGVAPHLTNDEVTWVLINSCEPVGAEGWTPELGYGRINAANAVALALSIGDGQCQVDIDGDGRFTLDDIEAFIAAFINGDPIADLVAPFGVVDFSDLEEFVDQVVSDCSGGDTP
ncbi:MAG: S8 family serine peptidase [Phycisphaerales bacterium]